MSENGSILQSIMDTMGKLEKFETGILDAIAKMEQAGAVAAKALIGLEKSFAECREIKDRADSLKKVIRDEECKWRRS
jgi:hypothetical protein